MFKTHKTLYLVLAIILALATGVGLLFAIQNFKTDEEIAATVPSSSGKEPERLLPVDTSNWQTYRNEEYGFEFKHPKESLIIENGPDGYEQRFLEEKVWSGTQVPLIEQIRLEYPIDNITFSINIPDKNFSPVKGEYDWWMRPCGQEGFAEIKSTNNITFAGYPTLNVVSVWEFTGQEVNYYCVNFPKNPIIIFYPSEHKIQANQILSTFKFIEQENFSYKLSYFGEAKGLSFNDEGYYDAELLRVNSKTGKKEVLVSSIKKAIPELQSQFNLTLQKLSFPETGNKLFFIVILSETDAPPGNVYSFDLSSQKFTKLQLSRYYSGFGPKDLSPDGTKLAVVVDLEEDKESRKLFLLDLERDAVRTLVILSGNETFNYCIDDCFAGIAGEVKWLDNNTVEYNVYDKNKSIADQGGFRSHPLIEIRKEKIE